METLDDTVKIIYDNYIKSLQEWIKNIKPIATDSLQSYLDTSGKKYYKYEYIRIALPLVLENDKSDIKFVYKRLSIKFHPDKFPHELANDLFALINKHNLLGNVAILHALDEIADDLILLPRSKMEVLLINLSIEDTYKKITNEIRLKPKEILAILTRSIDSCVVIDTEFIFSRAYTFFMDRYSGEKNINDMYYTEDELIKKIEQSNDMEFISFYCTTYSHNRRILEACASNQLRMRDRLMDENELLKTKIAAQNTDH